MFKILTLNQISVLGLERLPRDRYEIASEFGSPDAILLRSHKLQAADIGGSVKAIARAGAGVNNIPVAACSERGIPVFNTPGANANAVKELIVAALILGSRGILQGVDYVQGLAQMNDAAEMSQLLEKEKQRFKGNELAGKTLGVVGLGAIGSMVADTRAESWHGGDWPRSGTFGRCGLAIAARSAQDRSSGLSVCEGGLHHAAFAHAGIDPGSDQCRIARTLPTGYAVVEFCA